MGACGLPSARPRRRSPTGVSAEQCAMFASGNPMGQWAPVAWDFGTESAYDTSHDDSAPEGPMNTDPREFVSETLCAWIWSSQPAALAHRAVRSLLLNAALADQRVRRWQGEPADWVGVMADPGNPHVKEVLGRTWPELRWLFVQRFGRLPELVFKPGGDIG